MKTQDFRSVVTNYKAVFFDAFGVLKNHKGIIPGVENTFDFLDEKGIDYYVLTNDASRSPEQLARMYQDNGIPAITTDKVISSGMLAHDWLKLKIKSGRVAYLGTERGSASSACCFCLPVCCWVCGPGCAPATSAVTAVTVEGGANSMIAPRLAVEERLGFRVQGLGFRV